ncbi:DUF3772 domain-containing protein [Halovulum sp. GXIMD14793]
MTFKVLEFVRTCLFLSVLASSAFAQSNDVAAPVGDWRALVDRAVALVEADDTSTDKLDALRTELANQRSEIQKLVADRQTVVDELREQIKALGPPPEGDATEATELADRRKNLNDRLAEAQVPLLDEKELLDQTDNALDKIDNQVRSRFSKQLLSLGPSPVDPRSLATALSDTADYIEQTTQEIGARAGNSYYRDRMLQRLPVALIFIAAGLFLILGIYRRQLTWLREWAARVEAAETRPPPWLGTAITFSRLVTPVLGAAALYWGIRSLDLFGPQGMVLLDAMPAAIGILIWVYWISHSIFAPVLSSYRLVHLEDHSARACARYGAILGIVVAAQIVLSAGIASVQPQAATIAVLLFPLIVIGALSLWRLAARLQPALRRPEPVEDGDDNPVTEPFGLNLMRLLRRFVVVVALASPVLAIIGFTQASEFFLFATILTLGLLGSAYVIFIALQRLVDGYFSRTMPDGSDGGAGLLPVLLGFVIVCAIMPLLALVWGARRSDLITAWIWLRDGVSIGGARISLTDFMLLVVVFGIGYAITRFIQAVLRSSVLPRTRLDVGGRNAVVTGVGYVGIFLAAVAAITSTGIDLSGLAIVAGALSVGVGFGLQTIVSNFVSGIILLVERPIKQGDWIEVAGFSGHVSKISVRSTAIDTFDKATVIVPNQELIAGTVLNRTHGSLWGRVIVPVGVGYGTDPQLVKEILTEIAKEHPLVLRRPEPMVLFMNFGADALEFEIRAYLRDVNNMLSVRSEINFEIARRFAEAEIEIPFAQRDIHLRNPEALVEVLKGSPPPQNDPPQSHETPRAATAKAELPSEADTGDADGDAT